MAKKTDAQEVGAHVIGAAEFKARCLELMDRVKQTREEITITKHGKPVARLVACEPEPKEIFGHLKGSVTWQGDLISPIDVEWDADA